MYLLPVAIAALVMAATGCGSRCKEVEHARMALLSRTPGADRGADVRVTIPYERANTLFDQMLREEPLVVPLDVPDLGPIEITVPVVTATAREVRLVPGGPGTIRFAMRIELRDAGEEITTLALTTEVTPELERKDGAAVLAIGFGPENLLSLSPELGPDATRMLGKAVSRWLPEKVRVPRVILDAAASKLGTHLTGAAYAALQRTLLTRLGELTRLRLRLPDVPVGTVELRSLAERLVVEITTDLPVRRGLVPVPAGDLAASREVSVHIAGSAVAELANWAIASGHAPRWYTRGITPSSGGEFQPRFDYVAGDRAHPFKVYSFQERGGCSYFRVGIRAAVAMDGNKLKVTALDRELERTCANPVVEAAAWVKYFFVGSIDRSKRIAAHTRLAAGGRTLETQVVGAELADDELRFALQFVGGRTRAATR
jgi:hypothetical protein